MYFDSHTHLNIDELFANRENHLDDFREAGGIGLVNIGGGIDFSQRAISIAQIAKKKIPDDFFIGASIGLDPYSTFILEGNKQPNVTYENIDNIFEQLIELYRQYPNDICAIGECGIDLHFPGSNNTLQLQQELLARQCQFALETGLPMVIHSRNGFPESIEVLKKYFGQNQNQSLPIVFHCFGYGPDEITYLMEYFRNVYVGFDGNITYKSAQLVRDAFLVTPLEKILIETDAPYLTPVPHRGEINTPKNIVHTYNFMAQLQSISSEVFMKQIYENSSIFFNIDK